MKRILWHLSITPLTVWLGAVSQCQSASRREVEHTENREHTQPSSDQDDQ